MKIGELKLVINVHIAESIFVAEHFIKSESKKKQSSVVAYFKNIFSFPLSIIPSNQSENIKFVDIQGDGSSEKFNNDNPDFVYVAGGSFLMGSNEYDDEKPIHHVTISDFYISKYQVTQEFWQKIMGNNPSHFKDANLPVENVSWVDCQQFIQELTKKTGEKYRLPTEAEWEYAAMGGEVFVKKSNTFKFSGSNSIDEVAWYTLNSNGKTHSVGSKRTNELGIYDMSGNVWEWCKDSYEQNFYERNICSNPLNLNSSPNKILRGGSWNSNASDCSCLVLE